MAFEYDEDRARVPDAGGFIVRGGDHAPAIWAKRGEIHHVVMPLKLDEEDACAGIPNAGRVVERRGNDTRAVWAKRGRADYVAILFEFDEPFTCLGVPYLRGLARRGDDARAIWPERGGVDLRTPFKVHELLARPGIPHAGC